MATFNWDFIYSLNGFFFLVGKILTGEPQSARGIQWIQIQILWVKHCPLVHHGLMMRKNDGLIVVRIDHDQPSRNYHEFPGGEVKDDGCWMMTIIQHYSPSLAIINLNGFIMIHYLPLLALVGSSLTLLHYPNNVVSLLGGCLDQFVV